VRVALYIIGAAFEILGIVLIASPDLVPGAVRAAGWTRRRWRPIENRIRRWLRLPPRTIFANIGLATEVSGASRISAVVSTGADTIEKQVEFLLRRDQETQKAVNAIHEQLGEIARAAESGLDTLRAEFTSHVAAEIATAQADYRAVRIGGTVALVIGLVLSTAGNLVG
jgi:hypothetical protein